MFTALDHMTDTLNNMSSFVVTMPVFFVGLIVFHALEQRFPRDRALRHGPLRPGYLADITSAIVNGPGIGGLTKLGVYAIVTQAPQLHGAMGSWHWLAQFGLFLLVNDFVRYWLHRAYHTHPLLWRFHRVHHTATDMDALSTFRVHILEAVIKYGVIILPFHLLGVEKSVTVIYAAIDILKGFWHHANIRTSIGPLNYVFNSGELHWWHHAAAGRGMRSNYGSIFSVWDWLFGTAYWPKREWPTQIGVAGLDHFPESYLGQLSSVRHDDDSALRAYHDDGARAPDSSAERPHDERGPGTETDPRDRETQLPDGATVLPADR